MKALFLSTSVSIPCSTAPLPKSEASVVRMRSGLLVIRSLCDWFILFIHRNNSALEYPDRFITASQSPWFFLRAVILFISNLL